MYVLCHVGSDGWTAFSARYLKARPAGSNRGEVCQSDYRFSVTQGKRGRSPIYLPKNARTPSITRSTSALDKNAWMGRLSTREDTRSAFGHRAGANSENAF